MDKDERISEQMRSPQAPVGSRERVVAAAAEVLDKGARRRRWPVAAGLLTAAAIGFGMTAPGNAAVEWFTGVLSLKEEKDAASVFGEGGALVARGAGPEGHSYKVTATYPAVKEGRKDPGPCVSVDFDPGAPLEETAERRPRGIGFCGLLKYLDKPFDYLTITHAYEDYSVIVGAAPEDTASVDVRYRESLDGDEITAPTDSIPIAGEVTRRDGAVEPIFPFTFFVAFVPAGIGEVTGQSSAEAIALSESGDVQARADLAWTDYPSEPGFSVMCRRDTRGVCDQAASGELYRVERGLGRPLPDGLAEELELRGYEWTPATDEDRELAFDPKPGYPARLFLKGGRRDPYGLAFDRLGRISGPGFSDGQLVYLHHLVASEANPGIDSGYTDADSVKRNVDPLENPISTTIIDAETKKRLKRIEY